ncbi:8607_t:CDS:2, partial [Scutellospora calospora]
KLTPTICDDIKLLAECGVKVGVIIDILQRKNPEQYIHSRNIYNYIQFIRHQNFVNSDAAFVYLELIEKKQENPTFYIDARFEDQSLLSDEAKDSFTWLFNSFFNATGGLALSLLYTDTDPAMIAAATLLNEYDDATNYMQYYLYQCWETWALCFTHCAFNAGIQSMQRVESYNRIIKENINRNSSLLELEDAIERLIVKESQFVKFNEAVGELPASWDEDYHDHYFKKYHLTSLDCELRQW